jgi:hypothetical protein
VAKKGEKNGIIVSLSVCILCSFMYVMPVMPVFSAVAFILQLFQVRVDVDMYVATS